MKRKKKGGGGGSNWMDTYGDMVTLLLCFFVLLYSISTVTEDKWIAMVRSFNPNAKLVETETSGNDGPNADEDDPPPEGLGQGEVDQKMDKLYERLQAYVEEQGAESSISVTKGAGYVFVSFNQTVFFDGDSYRLRKESEPVLNTISDMLTEARDAIDEIQILGHTAQGDPNKKNDDWTDRSLASNRATIVTVYIQTHSKVDPGRLVSVGYGQHRAIASNDTREGRAQNRRVEMIISSKNVDSVFGDSIKQYYSIREGAVSPAE